MFNINDYLKKFSKTIGEVSSSKEFVIEVIKKTTKATLKKDDIEIKEGVLFLKTKPIIRAEIALKKQAILELLKERGIFDIK